MGTAFAVAGVQGLFVDSHNIAHGVEAGLGAALAESALLATFWRGAMVGSTHSLCSRVRRGSAESIEGPDAEIARWLFAERADRRMPMALMGTFALLPMMFFYLQMPGLAAAWPIWILGTVGMFAFDVVALPGPRHGAFRLLEPTAGIGPVANGSGAMMFFGARF